VAISGHADADRPRLPPHHAGETCPLILDEVTVQCDRERTRALLECLRAVSRERQVILFTQEEDVVEWAGANLREEEGDLLVRLETTAAIT
jgi:uncharacterized protein YhaN